jgi:hypothetical protein
MFDSLGETCTECYAPCMEESNQCTGLPTVDRMAELVVDSLPAPMASLTTNSQDADKNDDDTTNRIVTHARLIDKGLPLSPYAINNIVCTSRMYNNTYMLLMYDPKSESFYMLHSKRHYWVSGCQKVLNRYRII